MMLQRTFKILMYFFFVTVPLLPLKVKFLNIPLSADFNIGFIAILVGMIYLLIMYKKDKSIFEVLKDKEIKLLTIIIIIFVLFSFGSTAYSTVKSAAILETLRFLEYVLLFYIIFLISDSKFIKNGLRIIYITFIIASLYGVFQFIFNLSEFNDASISFNRGRIYSTFVNPNYWGAAVNLFIFIPIINLIEGRKEIFTNIVILLLFLFNLIFSFTRGSWLGFGVGLFVLFIGKYKKALLSIPLMIASVLSIPITRNRFLSVFNFNDWTNHERIKLWKTGLYMFRDHLWYGVGNGNYLYRYYEYIQKYPELDLGRKQYSVHNSYIKMFAELGIIGGLLFILIYLMLAWFIYKIYKSNTRKYKLYAFGLLGFWSAYLFQNFFNNLMFIPQLNVFVWILTALLYKGYLLEKQEDKI